MWSSDKILIGVVVIVVVSILILFSQTQLGGETEVPVGTGSTGGQVSVNVTPSETPEESEEELEDEEETEEPEPEVWCDPSDLEAWRDQMLRAEHFSVLMARNAEAIHLYEPAVPYKGSDMLVLLNLRCPEEHSVTDLKVNMRLRDGNQTVEMGEISLDDFGYEDALQSQSAVWETNAFESGVLRLEAKITYNFDGEPQTLCESELVEVSTGYGLGLLNMESYSDLSSPTGYAKFTAHLTGVVDTVSYLPMSAYIRPTENPDLIYTTTVQKRNCVPGNCDVDIVLVDDTTTLDYLCDTDRDVYLQIVGLQTNYHYTAYEKLNLTRFLGNMC